MGSPMRLSTLLLSVTGRALARVGALFDWTGVQKRLIFAHQAMLLLLLLFHAWLAR
jgi:hypothetical protein